MTKNTTMSESPETGLTCGDVTVDILPTLKGGDSSCETAMSCRENIPSCIDISIM